MECESLWHLSADGDQESDLNKGPPPCHNSNADYLQELCAAADRRLYRLVKWCKSLPLFKNIQVSKTGGNTHLHIMMAFNIFHVSIAYPG